MRRGNIIAGFLLAPFFIVFILSMTGLTPRDPANDGIFVIILILSAYTLLGIFLYLIVKNAAYLNNTAIFRIIYRHIGVIRICLFILFAFVTAVVAFVPKKRIAPVRDIRVSSVSLRLWRSAMIPRDLGSMDDVPFSADDVLKGCFFGDCRGAHQIRVSVEGRDDCLRFYKADAGTEKRSPLVFLEGDVVRLASLNGERPLWRVAEFYQKLTPNLMQGEVNFYADSAGRTLINLARPGIFGSTGRHLERRRPREVALVDAALDALKARFGWKTFDLAGFSGGGHLVGALLARRDDIGGAIITSGKVAVRQRGAARGLTTDVTGYADFIDPIDYASEIARRQPKRVIMLTDPMDRIVEARFQNAFGAALNDAGVNVEQRMIAAADTDRHNLRHATIIAGLACRIDE